MRKQLLCVTLLGILMSSGVYADGSSSQVNEVVKSEKEHFNRFYIGPEFFCYQLNTHVSSVEVKGTRFFSGFRIGYEYLKPKAFYAGVDLVGASSPVDFKVSRHGKLLSWQHAERDFFDWDFRLGYTFASKKWQASSFLGFGFYGMTSIDNHNQGYQEGAVYLSGGVRSKYIISPSFDVGFNVKLLSALDRLEVKAKHLTAKEACVAWGGELGVPLSWHVGSTKRWDLQAIPYLLQLDFSTVKNIYGLSLLCGYRF